MFIDAQSINLGGSNIAETTDSGADSNSSGGSDGVSTTSDDDTAGAALPDTSSSALNGVLTAESALVLGVLGDLDLLDDLTEGSTVTSTVLTNDTNLLSSLALQKEMIMDTFK